MGEAKKNDFTWADTVIEIPQIDQAKYLLLRCLSTGIKNEALAQDVVEFLEKDKSHEPE